MPLATYVHVRDELGHVRVFGPDDEVPEWAVRVITNPAAWVEGTAPALEPSASRLAEPKPAVKRAAPRRKATTSDDAVHGA